MGGYVLLLSFSTIRVRKILSLDWMGCLIAIGVWVRLFISRRTVLSCSEDSYAVGQASFIIFLLLMRYGHVQ